VNIEKLEKIYGAVLWTGKPNNFLGMPLNFTRYILTEKKLVIRKGFFNIREDKVELYRIMDMSMNLPITQRLFKCGTVHLVSKDVSIPEIDLRQIRNPYDVYNLVETNIEAQKKKYGVLGRDIVGAAMNLNSDMDLDNDGVPDNIDSDIK
jgi:hypothetical protein